MQYQVDSGSSQAARCGSRGQQSAVRGYLLLVVVGNCLFTNTDTAVLLARVCDKGRRHVPVCMRAPLDGNVWTFFFTFYSFFVFVIPYK